MNYKRFGLFFGIIMIAFLGFYWLTNHSPYASLFVREEPVTDGTNRIPTSVASLKTYSIGGVDQWVLTRGENTNNPVLLFLAGGPGLSEMAWLRKYNPGLEKYFTVVNWDQRGAGKSFDAFGKDTNISLQTWLSDTMELVDILRSEFRKDRIFLAGHGFGSLLGILSVRDHPEKFIAYVGIGQMVEPYDNDRLLYGMALQKAARTGETNALKELKDLGSPPYTGSNSIEKYSYFSDWVNRLNRDFRYDNDYKTNWMKTVLASKEYTSRDRRNFWKGFFTVFSLLYPEMNQVHITRDVPEVRVPVFFISGKYDLTSYPDLTRSYYLKLRAPLKKFYLFTNSANAPIYEENGKFNRIMTDEVLKLSK